MSKNLQDIKIDGKRVIVRCDFNVPIEDGKIVDDTRIIESLETLKYVVERASKTIILSHLGRIKKEEDKAKNTLYPVYEYLKNKLSDDIVFVDYNSDLSKIIDSNKIIMFENTRFFDLDNKKESNCDLELSKYFASLGDVYVNDAFGVSHRKNASNVGISQYILSCKGFLIQKEEKMLNKIKDNPDKPFIVIMGGSKISDKITLIDKLITKTDKFIISGAMAFTFLHVKGYNVGKSLIYEDSIDYVKDLLNKYSDKIILPIDFYVSDNFSNEGRRELKKIDQFNDNDMGLDIGPETINLYRKVLANGKTIFINGPVGAFEFSNYSYGTRELCNILNNLHSFIVVGGGDSASAFKKYNANVSFISTGGGAALEYIEGKDLPGLNI